MLDELSRTGIVHSLQDGKFVAVTATLRYAPPSRFAYSSSMRSS